MMSCGDSILHPVINIFVFPIIPFLHECWLCAPENKHLIDRLLIDFLFKRMHFYQEVLCDIKDRKSRRNPETII